MRVRLPVLFALLAIGAIAAVRFVDRGTSSTSAPTVRLRAAAATNVSRTPGPQSEVAVAADPRRSSTLVAGSNDLHAPTMRVYDSRDGGRHWRSQPLPLPRSGSVCQTSDPAVAIATNGRQYYAFLGVRCRGGRGYGTSIYVSTRSSGRAPWKTLGLPVSTGKKLTLADDRPSITVDTGAKSPHRGRLYVGWSRFSFDASSIWADPDAEPVEPVEVEAMVSHSDDGGRHWSKPTVISAEGAPVELRFALASDGTVYAVWRESETNAIYVSRSPDGGSFEPKKLVAASVVVPGHSCHESRARIPAQPRRCVSPNPVIAVDASGGPRDGEVYVVWGSTGLNGSQDVQVAAFAPDLSPRLGVERVQQVHPEEGFRGPDQFLPTAAIDAANGRLWACYYQSKGAGSTVARFTCTASDDGGRTWLTPVPATRAYSNESRKPANVANGFGDYEAVAATGGGLVATWTEGTLLRKWQEEIFAAVVDAVPVEVRK